MPAQKKLNESLAARVTGTIDGTASAEQRRAGWRVLKKQPAWLWLVTGSGQQCHALFWPIGHMIQKHYGIHKTGCTKRITMAQEDDRDMVMGNMHLKIW